MLDQTTIDRIIEAMDHNFEGYEYERALARSYWRTYEPELHSGVCAQCKKAFKIPTDLLDRPEVKERTQGELEFCSKRCLVDWRHERGLCTNCGAPIDELSGFLPDVKDRSRSRRSYR